MTDEIIPQLTKICTKCKIEKDIDMFHNYKYGVHGKKPHCKECAIAYSRKYKEEHKSEIKLKKPQQDKKYREKNKEKISFMAKIYRENNKEKISKKHKEWRDKNKESRKIYRDTYVSENKEKVYEYQKKYRLEISKNKTKEYNRRYRDKNKEKLRLKQIKYRKTESGKICHKNYNNKRRYIKKCTSDGRIPMTSIYPLNRDLQELLELQDNKCNICGCDITDKKHLDHHVPLSKGGTHSIDNVVFLCPTCNLTKNNKLPTTLLLI